MRSGRGPAADPRPRQTGLHPRSFWRAPQRARPATPNHQAQGQGHPKKMFRQGATPVVDRSSGNRAHTAPQALLLPRRAAKAVSPPPRPLVAVPIEARPVWAAPATVQPLARVGEADSPLDDAV